MIRLLNERQYKFIGLKDAWHLVYYIPKSSTGDVLSKEIIDFKNQKPEAIRKWTKIAAERILATEIQFDYIVRALGSAELTASSGRKSLDVLGTYLSKQLECPYVPQTLQKHRVTKPLHTLKTKAERYAEMHEVYFVADGDYDCNRKKVLVLDDVTTTNTTVAEIIRALQAKWPFAEIYFFCLGRTDYNHEKNIELNSLYIS